MKPGHSTQPSVFFRQFKNQLQAILTLLACFGLSGMATAQLGVTIDYTSPNCAGFNSGLATAQPTGGTAPFNYYWSNGQTGQTISNPSAGALSVTVTDAAFSSANASTTVSIPQEIVIVVAGAPDPCAFNGNYLSAEVTGGIAPYTYQWSNGTTGETITGLTQAGFYFVTVTDFNGCAKTGGGEYSPPVAISLALNPSACGGTCDGSIEAKIDQGMGPFTFSWSYGPQPTQQQQFPAPEGPYSVTVTDGQGCTDVESALLDDPDPLEISFVHSNPCGSPSNVTAEVTGGTPPFTYSWFNGNTSPTAYNVQPGTWHMTVYDAHGCGETATVTVANSDLEVNTLTTEAACAGNGGGTATATPSGGSGVYTYVWSNGETTQTVDDLDAGEYTVTVSDDTGCEQISTVTVEEAVSFTVDVQTTLYRCDGQGGSATVTVNGGSGSITYQWNDPAAQGGSQATNLEPGIYEVLITDTDGCEQTLEVEILDGSLSPSANAQAASCDDNGSVQITVGNATGTPTFEWSNGSTGPSAAGLAAGTYTVTVTDADGCEGIIDVEVPDASFDVNIEVMQQGCADEAVGILQATILGGSPTANYTYAWNNWAQSNTIGGLSPGTFEVTVSDGTGCEIVANYELTSSPPIEAAANVLNTPCNGFANGNVQLDVTGAAPFTYQWSNGSTEPTASNLAAGTYTVIITDANDCDVNMEVVLDENDMEIAAAITDPTCENTANGTVSVEVSAGLEPLVYEWSNGSSTSQIDDLTAGSYTVTVTDANGCVTIESIEVTPEIEVEVEFAWAALGCDDDGMTVDLSGTSSNASTWTWTLSNGDVYTGQAPQVLFDESPMDVTLTVTSPEGCEASASQTIEAAPISLDLQSEASLCLSETFTFDLSVSNSGTGTLTYNWSPADLIVSGQGTANPVFASDEAGEYTVSVEVSNDNCTVSADAVMTVSESTTIDPAAVSFSQCDDLTVDFENTSGVAGTWYFNHPDPTMTSDETNPSFTYPAAGDYEVVFVPTGSCVEDLALQLAVVNSPQVAFEASAADCNEPITIVFTNTSNITVDDFYWDFGVLGTSTEENPTLTVSGSQTVTATLVATFGNGCEQTVQDDISVESFTPPALESLQHVCNSGETAQLNPGGDDSYTYEWTGGALGTSTEVNPTVNVDVTTVYSVIITADNGCSTVQEVTVEVPDVPFALLPIDDIVSCDDDPVTVEALTNTPGATWVWALNEDFDTPVGEEQSLTVETSNLAITYFVFATDAYGCSDQTSFSVSNAAIDIDFDNAFEVCKGDLLEFEITLNNATMDDITNWSPFNPLENPVFATEDFTFDVVNAEGCMGHGEMTVKVVEFTDPLTLTAEPEEIWVGQSTQLSVTEDDDYSYEWSPAETLDDPTSATPIATPNSDAVNYHVVVTDVLTGCKQELEIEVKSKDIICDEPYIFVPNAFTPDGDGVNDIIKVEGFNVEELYFAIYNRWGEMVFETTDLDQGWDGTFRGAPTSGDVYGYYVKVRCPGGLEFFKKGNITVLK